MAMKKRLAALLLAFVMAAGCGVSAFADDSDGTGTTIGGANTDTGPQAAYALEDYLESQPQTYSPTPGVDTAETITLEYLNVVGEGLKSDYTLNLIDCLVGITYMEFGSIYSYTGVTAEIAKEVWKAQAVAIHSYLVHNMVNNSGAKSSNALIYTPVATIQENAPTTYALLRAAVEEVAHKLVVYGEGCDPTDYIVCNAVYSCSGGYNTQTGVYGTCAGLDGWGTETPYLQSVESPYDRTYHELLRNAIGKDYTFKEYYDSKHPSERYTSADTSHKSLGGFVKYGTLVANGRSYQYLNQFVSSRYCFDFDTSDLTMNYYGWGHGIGMTQTGALGYAKEEGWTYDRILAHYYTGTTLYDTATGMLALTADDHSYTAAVTVPTCTAEGYTTYTCSVCGDSYTADTVEALGHEMESWTTTTASGWAEPGTQQRGCARCEETETRTLLCLGDMDESGAASVADALTLANALAGKAALAELQTLAADVNSDGVMDVADLTLLLEYLTR